MQRKTIPSAKRKRGGSAIAGSPRLRFGLRLSKEIQGGKGLTQSRKEKVGSAIADQ